MSKRRPLRSKYDLSSLAVEGPSSSEQMKMQMEMESELLDNIRRKRGGGPPNFQLADMLPFLFEGISVVVEVRNDYPSIA